MLSFKEIVQDALADHELFGAEGACPALFEPGAEDSRLLVITGENAGGKSLFSQFLLRTVLKSDADWKSVEVMDGGMHRRTRSGIERALMYGDESDDSTGNISLKFVLTGIRTCRMRTTSHILSLDEPDIGLSEGYCMGLGELLKAFAADLPELTRGLVVVTHSREIVKRLIPLEPHCVRVGDLRPTKEWLEQGPVPRSIAEVESLSERSIETWRSIRRLMQQRRSEKRS